MSMRVRYFSIKINITTSPCQLSVLIWWCFFAVVVVVRFGLIHDLHIRVSIWCISIFFVGMLVILYCGRIDLNTLKRPIDFNDSNGNSNKFSMLNFFARKGLFRNFCRVYYCCFCYSQTRPFLINWISSENVYVTVNIVINI